jgi:hypothetical protein
MTSSSAPFAALALALTLAATPASAQLGELPPGAVSRSSASPSRETIFWIAFDPTPYVPSLPPGVRFRTLAEIARYESTVAAYVAAPRPARLGAQLLRDHPHRHDAVRRDTRALRPARRVRGLVRGRRAHRLHRRARHNGTPVRAEWVYELSTAVRVIRVL